MANELFENYWKFMIENEFQLINEMNNDFICNICNKLMVKACNAPCGCKHCSDCIENYVDMKENLYPEKDKYCQIKMINFERDVVIIYQTNRRIAEIIVKCPNKYCEFTDKLSLIENHMKTCDKNATSCPYFEIGCKNDAVMNDEMKDHLCTENYYHTKILDFINNLQNEMESLKNENKNLKKELDKIKIKSKSNQIKNEEMVVIKNENRSLMKKLENIEELRVIFEINEVIERMQRKSEQQTREIDEMKEKCEQTEKKEIEMRRIIDEIFDKIDSDLMKKSNNNYDERINNLQMKIIEIERITEKINFGKFEWKLENFSQQKRETRIYMCGFVMIIIMLMFGFI